MQTPWPPRPTREALPECPYCGEPVLREAWDKNGCMCSGCVRIDPASPDAFARAWLREWQTTVRRIHLERRAEERERERRLAEQHLVRRRKRA